MPSDLCLEFLRNALGLWLKHRTSKSNTGGPFLDRRPSQPQTRIIIHFFSSLLGNVPSQTAQTKKAAQFSVLDATSHGPRVVQHERGLQTQFSPNRLLSPHEDTGTQSRLWLIHEQRIYILRWVHSARLCHTKSPGTHESGWLVKRAAAEEPSVKSVLAAGSGHELDLPTPWAVSPQ